MWEMVNGRPRKRALPKERPWCDHNPAQTKTSAADFTSA
jgi:hypothetical protein